MSSTIKTTAQGHPEAGTRPSKARIRNSFECAAPTYGAAAFVQRRVCARLAVGLPATITVHRILDAGCGTGFALPLLHQRYPAARSIALDFAPAMLRHIGEPCWLLAGDLEHLPLASASIDLYWSSLAVQWCDLARALAEARRVLANDGALVLASLGPATFHELRTAFAGIDAHRHTLAFHTPDEISQLASQAGFVAVDVEKHTEIAHYADFRSLLRAVKAIGANQLGVGRRTGLLSRDAFARAELAAEALRTPDGLPLTYDVITLHART
ncbi:MAG TPA: methyltransferase domain-containing protein [Azonexus sp.]|jgi:malonyl-CoA O-methyltransferase|nr:methyltransferase domain-containing protein [Azonexus sp.]